MALTAAALAALCVLLALPPGGARREGRAGTGRGGWPARAAPPAVPPAGLPARAAPPAGWPTGRRRGATGRSWPDGAGRRTLRRLRPRASGGLAAPGREDVADLAGRLAALSRAGLPAARAWQVLAASDGPGAALAGQVGAMVGAGGSVSDGLRFAAAGLPPGGAAEAVAWLATASDVAERSGAPSAVVHDGIAEGVRAELARLDEQEVALASARTTGAVLQGLPLAGIGLGMLIGANPVSALTGTAAGRNCLVLGVATWLAGRLWIRHLVTSTAT